MPRTGEFSELLADAQADIWRSTNRRTADGRPIYERVAYDQVVVKDSSGFIVLEVPDVDLMKLMFAARPGTVPARRVLASRQLPPISLPVRYQPR